MYRQTYSYFTFWLFTCLIFLQTVATAQEFPERPRPARLVNDFAGILSASQRQTLESALVAYDDSTSTQIAVVTVPTLNDYDVADYAVQLGEKWGIGRKQKDNGLLLLVAPNERKVTIQVGYGLEGAIPDATAKTIISQRIIPYFKQNNYPGGIAAGVQGLMQAAAGEFKGEPRKRGDDGGGFPTFLVIIIIVIILISIFGKKGGGGGGSYSRRGYRGYGGGPIIFGGGGFGGGGGSFGGGGGGGFGGFGGGSFGGGGASGDW